MNKFSHIPLVLAAGVAFTALPLPAWRSAAGEQKTSSAQAEAAATQFLTKVKPLLEERCSTCHGEDEAKSGLRVDSRDALLRGGDRGPAIVPGKPDASLLIQAVRQTGELKMPRRGKLTPDEIDALAVWIKNGAPWPESN